MELRVKPTPDQEAFIRDAIATGRYQSAEDVARVALQRWEDDERRRAELVAELNSADASIDRGEGVRADTREALTTAFDAIRTEARSRYQARQKNTK